MESYESHGLCVQYWQTVLPDALPSIRSLLCTDTNITPHERIFHYSHRSSNGVSQPSWLCNLGSVNKMDPLVEEVELIQENPYY